MTINELKDAIRLCIEGNRNVNVETYLVLKNGEIKKANILEGLQPEIQKMFVDVLQEKILNPENSLLTVSSADERTGAIYQYDLEITDSLQVFNQVLIGINEFPTFSFRNDGVNSIDAFLFVIGNAEYQMAIYKRLASVNVYQKRNGLFIREEDNQFAKLNSDVVKIIPQIDAFMINGEIFVMDLKLLETAFQIHEVIKTAARQQIDLLASYDLVENIDSLETELENITFARKFSKLVTNSPVLGIVDNQRIINFTKNHPALRNKFRYTGNDTKLELHTKLSKKLFVKLLNDDYLTSTLTNQDYDSIAKDKVIVAEE